MLQCKMEIVMMYFSNTVETEYLDMKYCHLPTYGFEICLASQINGYFPAWACLVK